RAGMAAWFIMRNQIVVAMAMVCAGISGLPFLANAATDLDTIGLTLLRITDPSLTGMGVRVAQAEAPFNAEGTAWEVNPFSIGQPTNLFTYISGNGSASNFPNDVGVESGHADAVALNFYGASGGVAPGVAHVDNFEAGYFYQAKIILEDPIPARIVNQSFIFSPNNPPQATVDTLYDKFAETNNVLFVSGIGNGGPPSAPSTAYNGIGVGAIGGSSSAGPTTDNGRSKPDLTAPGGVTSFSTPYVAGAAAVLRQAGSRGDGGPGTTNSAADIRTIKALLLNGTVKPAGWTHTATAPLDTRYGAGVLNVFNSYKQLAAGRTPFNESTSLAHGSVHPAGRNPLTLAQTGWDFNTISSSVNLDKVNHYYLDLPANGANGFTVTATLVWNRSFGQSSPNNLDLFLYDTATGTAVASSVSTVDNVEHIYFTNLVAGHYDLQVFKPGGLGKSVTDTYALAFAAFRVALDIAKSGSDVVITWPIFPAGFRLETTPNLNPPVAWTESSWPAVTTTNENRVTIPAPGASQYFRLVSP
ncbi:MAG: S8 family serine peptidase, partial [Verrucomicrobiota bacterium]